MGLQVDWAVQSDRELELAEMASNWAKRHSESAGGEFLPLSCLWEARDKAGSCKITVPGITHSVLGEARSS
jgi:hypothetical protein